MIEFNEESQLEMKLILVDYVGSKKHRKGVAAKMQLRLFCECILEI